MTTHLRLFPMHNRQSLLKANPGLLSNFRLEWKWVKRWYDPHADLTRPQAAYKIRYPTIGLDGQPKMAELLITNELAANVNLPGLYSYPKWQPFPTAACYVGEDGERISDVDSWRLSTRDNANRIKVELEEAVGLNKQFMVEEEKHDPPHSVFYPNTETRRLFLVRPRFGKLATFNVGRLLEIQKTHGRGSPGEWNVENRPEGLKICWYSDVPVEPTGEDYPELPCPCRELRDNETLKIGDGDNRLLPKGALYIHTEA
jgi:hypothetical protein